jgi:hypothetical protein
MICMEAPTPRKDRIVYSTAERMAYRGVHARAKSFGYTVVRTGEGIMATYVSAGIPERVKQNVKLQFHACPVCKYSEASLIAVLPSVCPCCKEDASAIHALWLQEEWGIELGWRRPLLGVVQDLHEYESGLSLMTTDALRMRAMRARGSKCA